MDPLIFRYFFCFFFIISNRTAEAVVANPINNKILFRMFFAVFFSWFFFSLCLLPDKILCQFIFYVTASSFSSCVLSFLCFLFKLFVNDFGFEHVFSTAQYTIVAMIFAFLSLFPFLFRIHNFFPIFVFLVISPLVCLCGSFSLFTGGKRMFGLRLVIFQRFLFTYFLLSSVRSVFFAFSTSQQKFFS